jgi:hypothetical protein
VYSLRFPLWGTEGGNHFLTRKQKQFAGWQSDIRGFSHSLHTSEELTANYLRVSDKTYSKVKRGFLFTLPDFASEVKNDPPITTASPG